MYYLKVKYYGKVKDYPNAGPKASITGMKKLYGYGKNDCVIVKCGNYIYNVPEKDFYSKISYFAS